MNVPLLLAALLGAQGTPSAAQGAAAQLPRLVIEEPCDGPRAPGDIVVCGRRDSDERHRLPLVRDRRFDPGGTIDSVSRERNRLLGPSASSLGSCNNVGPGGMTGCLNQGVWARREQRGR